MEDEQLRSIPRDPSTGISTLPGELLLKILTFVVTSDTPVYFWRFPNLNFDTTDRKYYGKKGKSGFLSVPTNQREHHRNWLVMSMTCHRFRQYGLPAFFRENTFIVPASMLRRQYVRNKERAKSLYLAMETIRRIIVTCRIGESVDFLCLHHCHDFTSLASMTIWAPQYHEELHRGLDYNDLWPTDIPEEFLDLLMRMGSRVNDIEVKLVICTLAKSMIEGIMDRIRDGTYTQLRVSLN